MKIQFVLPFAAVLALTACSHKYYPEMYQVVEEEANVVVQTPQDSSLLTPPIEADQPVPGFGAAATDTLAASAQPVAAASAPVDSVATVPADTVVAPTPVATTAPADTVVAPTPVATTAPTDTVAAAPVATPAPAPAPVPEKIRETQDVYTSAGVVVKDAYHVVVGSFRSQVNAQNMNMSLQAKGYMAKVAVNQDGLYRVFAYSTDNEPDVRKALALIRTNYPDAWMLKIAK